MKMKKICVSILAVGLSSSIISCGDGKSSEASKSQLNKVKNLKNSTDNIEGVWGAVTGADAKGREGRTAFLFTNASDADITRLGCISTDTDMPLTASGVETIKSGAYPIMKADNSTKWKQFTQLHNGAMYEPLSKQESVLLNITGDGGIHQIYSKAAELTCYYKIANGISDPMFVKLVGHNEDYYVSGLTFQDIDKPYIDASKLREVNPVLASGIAKGVGVFGVFAAAYVPRMTDISNNRYLFNEFFTNMFTLNGSSSELIVDNDERLAFMDLIKACKNNVNIYAKTIEDAKVAGKPFTQDIIEQMWENVAEANGKYIEQTAAKYPRLFDEAFIKKFKEGHNTILKIMNNYNGEYPVKMNFDLINNRVTFTANKPNSGINEISIADQSFDRVQWTAGFSREQASKMAEILYKETGGDMRKLSPSAMENLYRAMSEDKALFPYAVKNRQIETLSKLVGNEEFIPVPGSIEARNIMETLRLYEPIGEFQGFGEAGQVMKNAKSLEALHEATMGLSLGEKAFAGVTTVFSVASIFAVQSLMDLFTLPPAQGTYDTSITNYKWMQITPEEMLAWNAAHTDPSHQIRDNTTVVLSKDVYKNSTYQAVGLKYKDSSNGIDKQFSYNLEMTTIDTPFLRMINDTHNDPFFGDVSVASIWNNGNAVLGVTLKNNNQKDNALMQLIRNSAIQSLKGVNVFAVVSAPELISKPKLSSISPQANGQLSSGLLLSSAKDNKLLTMKVKTPNVGDVDGYVLPTDSQLTFQLRVGSNYKDATYSLGLNATYVPMDDNSDSNLTLVHSVDAYNRLLGAIPALYTSYSCNFPYKYGDTCNFNVALTNNSVSTTKTAGKLYLNDTNGERLALPVFIGYNLILDQKSITTEGDSDVKFVAMAAINGGYDKLTLSNLPKGAKVIKGCGSKLQQGQQCEFQLDFSNVDEGTYNIAVTGVKGSQTTPNDIENISISVVMPY